MPDHAATAVAVDASDPGFPLDLIGAVIDRAGVAEKRRRLLPAASVMIFVLGLALFTADSYGEVARKLAPWLAPLAGPGGWRVPGSCALAVPGGGSARGRSSCCSAPWPGRWPARRPPAPPRPAGSCW